MKNLLMCFIYILAISFVLQSCGKNNQITNDTIVINKIKENSYKEVIEINKNHKSIPILYYHSITDDIFGIEELHVSPSNFDKQMKYIKDNYDAIGFEDLDNVNHYENPVIITMDDGYKNNYTEAYPILKKYNIKATIYIIPESLGDKTKLTEDMVKNMTDLVSFQGHTMTHCKLDEIPVDKYKEEIVDSKNRIEELTGVPVICFAYPYGKYNNKVMEEVSKHYKYAVTIKQGLHNFKNNYEIKRIYVPRGLSMEEFKRKLESGI